MSKLLINEPPLQVLPSLARAIGLNEAIVLQQLHYWMAHAKTKHEGRQWVYKTYEEWQTCFPFWSIRTIKSVFAGLKASGLVCVQALSDDKWNRVNFYSVNYEKLEEITGVQSQVIEIHHSAEVAPSIVQKLHHQSCKPCTIDSAEVALSSIPENTTENTTEKKAPAAKETTSRATTLPTDFAISEQVREWATKQGFAPWLDLHLEHFRDYALSKGKTYADWDAAFRNAIRDDWGDVRKRTPSPAPVPVTVQKPRTDIVSPERRAERVAMLRAAMIGRGVH